MIWIALILFLVWWLLKTISEGLAIANNRAWWAFKILAFIALVMAIVCLILFIVWDVGTGGTKI